MLVLPTGFRFSYHRYGPYSEELSIAASDADALGYVEEREKHAAWGGGAHMADQPFEEVEKGRIVLFLDVTPFQRP